MKKTLFLSMILSFPAWLTAQVNTDWGVPYDETGKQIVYEEVIEVPGVSKEELFNRAITWIESYYTAGASKITKKSKEEGIIELKDRLMFFKMEKKTKVTDVIIDYNMTIYIKEGKIKYRITNFRAFQGSTSPHIEQWMEARYSDPETAKTRYTNLNEEILKIIDALKKDIQSGTKKNEDDW